MMAPTSRATAAAEVIRPTSPLLECRDPWTLERTTPRQDGDDGNRNVDQEDRSPPEVLQEISPLTGPGCDCKAGD